MENKRSISDGVSKQTRGLNYSRSRKRNIWSYFRRVKNILDAMNPYRFNKPQTLEQLHYRNIFTKYYKSASAQKLFLILDA